jgi:hypothetical protein
VITKRVSPAFAIGVVLGLAVFSSSVAATRVIPADRDATLIEEPDGAAASGSGPAIFAGRTALLDNTVRRALLRFDVTSGVRTLPRRPVAAAIDRVAVVVTVVMEPPQAGPREFRLHRLLSDWGEGASSSPGGTGAPAAPGDATWIHAFYPDQFWMHNGGQFEGEPSARLVVDGPGVYRFEGDGLLSDVQLWSREPDRNFGWILIGDETERQTARAFASRESVDPSQRPVLEIRYFGRP